MIKQFYYFFLWMRPKQWIKNFIILIPLVFSWSFFDINLLQDSILWFILFSIFVWSIYILNDFKDIDLDKNHPKKKNRPLASWKLNKKFALILSFFLILLSLTFSYFLFWNIVFLLFFFYLLNTIFYIFWIKNIVILDIFSISWWFILRWLIWIFLINTDLSIWFLLILFFWSLLLWFLKRYQEVKLWLKSRKNIELYNEEFLKYVISMITTLIIMAYSFYTFNSVQNQFLIVTIPFVVFWLIRYFYNIFFLQKYKEWIEEVILWDKFLLSNLFLYLLIVFWIIYFW